MITILISRFKSRFLVIGLMSVFALAACSDGGSGEEHLSIVATTSIWGDVVTQIVGDDAEVEVLIPRHVDAHDYQPTPQQASSLLEADLVIANGLGLEEGLHDVLENAEADGANVLELAPLLDPLPFESHDQEEEEDHDHGDLDPHVWFDPQRVALAAHIIAEELAAVDSSIDWAAYAREYADEIALAGDEMELLLSAVPESNRKLVTNHEALGYLANRFNFEIVGVVIPGGSTLSDPSSAELAELVQIIEEEGVDVIFTETSAPSRLAEAVASEVGRDVSIVSLFTESPGDAGTPAGTLVGLLVEDARLISEALG